MSVAARELGAGVAGEFPILAREGLVYLDSAATSQKPQAVLDSLASSLGEHNANIHRGVYPLAVEATDRFEGAAGDRRPPPRRHDRGDDLHQERDRGDQPRRLLVGPAQRRRRRPDRPDAARAPLEHRPLADPRPGGRRRARLRRADRGRAARPRLARRAAAARSQARRRRPHLQRARHGQPDRRDHRPRARRRRARARRRRPGRPAPRGRRARAAGRLLRLHRPQGLRPDGDRRARRAPRAARGDAAVPRRRGHDLLGRLRDLPLERPALEVRGRHHALRRGHRARRRARVDAGARPRRDRGPRARADRLPDGAAARTSSGSPRSARRSSAAARSSRSSSRAPTRTTSPRSWPARASASAPGTTAPSR